VLTLANEIRQLKESNK